MQFHATVNELRSVIIGMLDKGYFVMGYVLTRDFKLISINKQTGIDEFKSLFGVIVSKNEIQKADSYSEFLANQDDYLGMYIGEETDSYLLESTIWAAANTRAYSKNHMYTVGAKERYDSGVIIRQFEQSFSHYALVKEEELNCQETGIMPHKGCVLEKIDDSHYKYSWSIAYVNIIRNEDGTWYYTRLENISRSEDFDTLLELLDVAYFDMLASKL